MKNFSDLAKARYSVRDYRDLPVEEEKLRYILECGRVAPSAANYQPWHIVVIRDPGMRKKLAGTYNRQWFLQAPVILVICGDHHAGWRRADGKDHTDIDAAIITDHITLAATEQGLGTCWICNFDAVLCRKFLALPENIEPIAYLSLGYPSHSTDENVRHLKRKSMGEIIHYETY